MKNLTYIRFANTSLRLNEIARRNYQIPQVRKSTMHQIPIPFSLRFPPISSVSPPIPISSLSLPSSALPLPAAKWPPMSYLGERCEHFYGNAYGDSNFWLLELLSSAEEVKFQTV